MPRHDQPVCKSALFMELNIHVLWWMMHMLGCFGALGATSSNGLERYDLKGMAWKAPSCHKAGKSQQVGLQDWTNCWSSVVEAGTDKSWVALRYLGKGLIKYVESSEVHAYAIKAKLLGEDYHRAAHSYQEFNCSPWMFRQLSQYLKQMVSSTQCSLCSKSDRMGSKQWL